MNGKQIELQGDPTLTHSLVSLKKYCVEGDQGFMVELNSLGMMRRETVVLRDIQKVVDSFSSVFKQDLGLPSPREQDHGISLKEGSNPPNLRPYKYPITRKIKSNR